MSAELATGLFGAFGTILGIAGTAITNSQSSRTTKKLSDATHEHEALKAQQERDAARAVELSNVRQAACVSFLTLAARFREVADEYSWLLEAPHDQATADVKDRYQKAWADFSASTAPVQIAGPPELAEAATRLHELLLDYGLDLDQYTRGEEWIEGRHGAKNGPINDARGTFTRIAQSLFDPSTQKAR